jgi:hypothetical protein
MQVSDTRDAGRNAGPNTGIARRPFLTVLLGALGVGVLGGLAYEAPRLFRPRFAPTAFDDLLGRLPDRSSANRFGAAFLTHKKDFDPKSVAQKLRARLSTRSLSGALDEDIDRNRIVEVNGWVVPDTLAALCALAAVPA